MLEVGLYIIGFFVITIGFVAFFGAPYVPTLGSQIQDIGAIYSLKKSDVFVDIGSGDGIVLRAVAESGARVVGFELGPWLWLISKLLSRNYQNITIYFGNFWRKDLPAETTVVYTFLASKYMSKIEQKLQAHVNKGGGEVYFISHGFKLSGRKIIKTRGLMYLYLFSPQNKPYLQT